MQSWTIQKLLSWMTEHFTQKGLDSPRLSAELLLAYVLSMKRIELYMYFDKPVEKPQLDTLHELVKRAAANEPIGYLTGKTEFYSLEIKVSPDTLIPRPETELLVERAIEFLRTRQGTQYALDLCTGSGCVAVAIAKNFPDIKLIATDISDSALKIARQNIEHHNLTEKVELLCGDLFEPLITGLDVAKFDLIACNPPYVSTSEYESLAENVKNYEPKLALHAGPEGLDVYKRIIEKTTAFLKPDAALMLEIGYKQADAVKKLLENSNAFRRIRIEKDFAANDRIIIAQKTA